MRYLFLILPILFVFSSFAKAEAFNDASEITEETSEEDNDQNSNDQEDSEEEDDDEEDREESDTRQSASARFQQQNISVYGDSSRQKFKTNKQRRTRTDLSVDAASVGENREDAEENKSIIDLYTEIFDPITHEIVIQTPALAPRYLNKSTQNVTPNESSEQSAPITHESIIETEPYETKYLNEEYWDKIKENTEKEIVINPDEPEEGNDSETDFDD